MEKLTRKLDEQVKCPYCGEISESVFNINETTFICDHCEKEFKIEIWVSKIEIRSFPF